MSAVPFDWRVDGFDAFFTSSNLRSTTDTTDGRDRICGGRDPGDITEQVFDTEADTPESAPGFAIHDRRQRSAGSLLVGRHLEPFADAPPDALGGLAVGQRLADRATAELAEHVVLRQRVGMRAEGDRHPLPEVREPHRSIIRVRPLARSAGRKSAANRATSDAAGTSPTR